MKSVVISILIFIAVFNSLKSNSAANFQQFKSIEGLIEYETLSIFQADNIKDLANAYLSRAESYLVSGNAQRALDDLNSGYDLGLTCEDEATTVPILLRSYLGMTLAYSHLGLEEEALIASKNLGELVESIKCPRCQEIGQIGNIKFCDAWIDGEVCDNAAELSNWCEEAIVATANAMKALAEKSKTLPVKLALYAIISGLETRGLKCCRSGEFWKICVAPIFEKWKIWNEKYTVFRIPPDPAWD